MGVRFTSSVVVLAALLNEFVVVEEREISALCAHAGDSKLCLEWNGAAGVDHLGFDLGVRGDPEYEDEFAPLAETLHVVQVEEAKATIVRGEHGRDVSMRARFSIQGLIEFDLHVGLGVDVHFEGHCADHALLKRGESGVYSVGNTNYR